MLVNNNEMLLEVVGLLVQVHCMQYVQSSLLSLLGITARAAQHSIINSNFCIFLLFAGTTTLKKDLPNGNYRKTLPIQNKRSTKPSRTVEDSTIKA